MGAQSGDVQKENMPTAEGAESLKRGPALAWLMRQRQPTSDTVLRAGLSR